MEVYSTNCEDGHGAQGHSSKCALSWAGCHAETLWPEVVGQVGERVPEAVVVHLGRPRDESGEESGDEDDLERLEDHLVVEEPGERAKEPLLAALVAVREAVQVDDQRADERAGQGHHPAHQLEPPGQQATTSLAHQAGVLLRGLKTGGESSVEVGR